LNDLEAATRAAPTFYSSAIHLIAQPRARESAIAHYGAWGNLQHLGRFFNAQSAEAT
jgi:hypothetical protein